ncbi:MAG TPA: hypothetical protein GX731_06595, partial [Clostridiales bacterium]|nr:hypothetical protein [Clostridiales bacterium]
MNEELQMRIMQSLGLDYNPAINSTLQFQRTIGGLNEQLGTLKVAAMQSAKDINSAFSSQLGQISGSNIVDQFGKPFKTMQVEAKNTVITVDKMAKSFKESSLEQMKAQAASVQQRASAKGISQEYAQQATVLREQISTIQQRLQSEGKLTAEEVKQTDELKEQLELLRAQTRTAMSDDTRDTQGVPEIRPQDLNSRISDGAKFYAMVRAGKEATETIKSVETGMINIQRVIEDSSFVFNDYRDDLLGLGVAYGQSFETVQETAMRWVQSGYDVAESLRLTETSLLALNAAELDATNATESM